MTSLAEHWAQGGFEKGVKIGKAEGVQIGEARVIKMMIANGNSIDTISKITGIPLDQINQLQK